MYFIIKFLLNIMHAYDNCLENISNNSKVQDNVFILKAI